jgi:hypothetical protein
MRWRREGSRDIGKREEAKEKQRKAEIEEAKEKQRGVKEKAEIEEERNGRGGKRQQKR